MPLPIPFRQRIGRFRILIVVCLTVTLGSYTLIAHSSTDIRSKFKPFRTFSIDFIERYGYADDDAIFMANEDDYENSVSPDRSPAPTSTAARLIASGLEACEGWTIPEDDAEMAEREMTSTCWKDTHYRQIKKYLERAEGDKTWRELSWHNDLIKSNLRSLQSLSDCLPFFGANDLPEGCHDNMVSVIVTQDWWIDMAIQKGSNSGETVWMQTVTDTLQEENYTIISLSHWNYKALVTLHNAIPDVITHIYAKDFLVISCLADPRCRSDFPPDSPQVDAVPPEERGTIPSWKLSTVTYWGARPANHTKQSVEFGNLPGEDFTFNPLGNEWTVSPFPYPDHTYIPMTLEKSCTEHKVVPQDQRKDEVVVLRKLFEYFYPHRISAALPTEVWPSFQDETWLVPIANAHALRESDIEQETPEGLVNRGPLSMADYNDQVAHAKAYLGIGRPDISPSPYLALCQGVPVILPYYGDTPFLDGWDLYHPDLAQHGPAALIGAPYVYSYNPDDMESLYEAVRSARDNPIDRFIPNDMRYEHVRSEVLKMLNTNWERRARQIEDTREERGEPRQALVKEHIIQRLFQRGNGWRIDERGEAVQTMLPVGRYRQGQQRLAGAEE